MTAEGKPNDDESQDAADDESAGSEDQHTADPAAVVAQIVEQVTARTSQEIDRRIGHLMKTLQSEYGLKKGDGAGAAVKVESQGLPDQLARRLLKSALRESMTDMEFVSVEEKKAAWGLASKLADTWPLPSGADDYEIAGTILGHVSDSLQELRKTYEGQVRADLKRRGLLADEAEDGEKGQPPKRPGQGQKTPQQKFDSGAQRAKELFPGRVRNKEDEGE